MRLHFYTGIAMSALAADYAMASNAEAETSLDTASTAESWVGPYELSQVESEKGIMAAAAKSVGKATGATKSKSSKAKKAPKPVSVKSVKKPASKPTKKPTKKVTAKSGKKTSAKAKIGVNDVSCIWDLKAVSCITHFRH